jgi:hypothetical protein
MTATASAAVVVTLLARLRRARDHIDRHYREPLDLDRLARVAGVSKYHLVRTFEATYGETPIRYLTRRRIERAQDLRPPVAERECPAASCSCEACWNTPRQAAGAKIGASDP